MTKWVYLFEEGNKDLRDLLGGKGASLAEMTNAKLPIPPGFTITTEAYNANGRRFPSGMWKQTLAALKTMESKTGMRFGDSQSPLLVSVRSGAKFSMPGMMDTVLNLGLNSATLKGIEVLTKNPRFAQDAYRRFISMFGRIVIGIEGKKFDAIFDDAKRKYRAKANADLDAKALEKVVAQFKELYEKEIGEEFPENPYKQLDLAIRAVFGSWMSKRAVDYRRINKIPNNLGTAVNVVTMVFGNMGEDSGTGVAFTRNPATGERELFGEYLINAQGEDVVAGIRTPIKITEMQSKMPGVYAQLCAVSRQMEKHYRDMQDFEFTVERGKLYVLQTRTGKRTAYASLRLVIDFLDEHLLSEKETIFRVEPSQLVQIFSPRMPPDLEVKPITIGLNASPGAANGIVVFNADTAETLGKVGKEVILVLDDTSPEDVHGLYASKGMIAKRISVTGHAAVVCRGAGIPCVAGAPIIIDQKQKLFRASDEIVKEGDLITIDGNSGKIYRGKIPLVSLNVHEDAYLIRYASLLWSVDPDDYLEDSIGVLWLLRDIIRDKSIPRVSTPADPPIAPRRDLVQHAVREARPVSFVQPPDSVIHNILAALNWKFDGDTELVVWGTMMNLTQLLQSSVGIGNHHLAFRPLTDPLQSFVDPVTRESMKFADEPRYQLVGMEFFRINHFLRNYLTWGTGSILKIV